MKTISRLLMIAGVAMCVATPVLAESAPVYDADSMQENGSDQSYLPPQEQSSGFIPVQPTVSAAPQQAPLSMDQRLQRMEQQLSNMQNSDAATRVDSLQEQVQALRGQVEQLTHQLEQVQNQQKSMYTDLDGRLSGKPKTSLANPVDTPDTMPADKPAKMVASNDTASPDQAVADTSPDDPLPVATPTLQKAEKPMVIKTSKKQGIIADAKSQPNVAQEQQIYQTAYNFIKAKRYNDAVTALQSMLKKYPSGQFASNAHYWLGELYGLMGKNDQALNEFSTVVDAYPDSPRVSDAQLKVGLLLASQLKWIEAKAALKRVINHYPGSASARLAAEQLKQIKIAGH